MKRSELLEIIDQLDAAQTRLAIDLLCAVLDGLERHLRRVDPPDGRRWRDPPWLDAGDDTPAE
jgi:hypothetical protein